jgi:hypothetical protein
MQTGEKGFLRTFLYFLMTAREGNALPFDGICAIRIRCIDEYGEKIVPVFTNNSKLKAERK